MFPSFDLVLPTSMSKIRIIFSEEIPNFFNT